MVAVRCGLSPLRPLPLWVPGRERKVEQVTENPEPVGVQH